MESKELDCLLVEGKTEDGFLLKFTFRGSTVDELKTKWDKAKLLWFPGLIPNTPSYTQKPATSQNTAVSTGLAGALGNCAKCGAPNAVSNKSGKKYCSALCWTK